ncbi:MULTISPECIES: carbohydrate ABC transporter permease [Streptomyces]|uniref:Carbohydrate ABC transporter permease n=1 Tax=Streptomyces lycii TaxID=2654337 RepID=A0ABQ7FIK2_9ACTN|nr:MULTISPECIES: carbohydrate ABC transporter permease [Streptomyces]KAF4408452.1 carbohydrate ABC transporter permease [Streptomyces lycii]PGH51686.1 sugar ABC transporter permease [Streptomyces sp. Ru87]
MTATITPPTPRRAPRAERPPRRPRPTPGRVVAWAAMALIVLLTLFPFYWMLRTALSTNTALPAGAGSPLPADFSWGGFLRALGLQSTEDALAEGGAGGSLDFWRYLANSVFVSTLVTGCQLLFSAMAAYAFSRLRWRGRDTVFALVLGGLMVPTVFTLLPNFVLVKDLGLVDTLLGIALPTMFMTPFAVFFLRQFFLTVPREVEEAALLDGAGKVRVFFRLILPMAGSPLATLGILTYVTAWNDYFWPLMVSYSDSSRVLTVALSVFRSQTPQTGTDWAGLMAATFIAALPMIALFALLARRVVNSIGFSGIK